MLDVELLQAQAQDTTLLSMAFEIYESQASGHNYSPPLALSIQQKVVVSSLVKEIQKMVQLNRERLSRTLKMNGCPLDLQTYLLERLQSMDSNKPNLCQWGVVPVQSIEHRLDIQVLSKESKKIQVHVLLSLVTTQGERYVYRLSAEQFQQYRMQMAQLYKESINEQ